MNSANGRLPEGERPKRSSCRALQPPLLPRQPVGLDAVADAELADGFGQVVAHGAVREVELGGDLVRRQTFAGEAQGLRATYELLKQRSAG